MKTVTVNQKKKKNFKFGVSMFKLIETNRGFKLNFAANRN